MKRKFFAVYSAVAATALVTIGVALSTSKPTHLFAQFSPATAGTWVHYEMSLPGTVAGAPNNYGVREYWVQCGGGYQFTKPDVADSLIKEGGKNYDFSEFPSNGWEARLIIPSNQNAGEFHSVLYDTTTQSASFNEVAMMKNFQYSAASELPTAGESKKVLWLDNNGNRPSFYAETLGATRVFSDYNTFKSVFKSAIGTQYGENEYLDGYYVLASDISINSNVTYGDATIWSEKVDRGFSGTFDGRGHAFNTMGGVGYYNTGMFGLLTGAKICNVDFNTVTLKNYDASTIAQQAHDSIFSNIKVNLVDVSPTEKNYGSIICRYSQRNLFENITITHSGTGTVPCLFGTVGDSLTNIYDNILFVGNSEAPVAVKSNTEAISVVQKGYQFANSTSTLISRERQDIYVNSSSAIALDVGDAEVGTVTDITVKVGTKTYSLGSDLTNLDIPSELKSTPADHGQGLITITNSDSATFALPVTLVTQYISTYSDLNLIRGRNLGVELYGYFALKNDITVNYSEVSTESDWNTTTGNGFYGEFDGRGYTLKGNISAASNGIISAMRNEAVIKNLVINNTGNTGWGNSSLISGSSGLNVLHQLKLYNIEVTATLVGTHADHTSILCKKFINNAVFANITVNSLAGNGVNVSGFNVSLFPTNYFTASTRFNHITWNTASGALTNRVIAGIDNVPYGVTINLA